MDEARAQAYLLLIQTLLNCPNGDEPQILKDIAFIRKMRYDITDLNGVKNIEPQNVMQL